MTQDPAETRPGDDRNVVVRGADWMFRDRTTGGITIAQVPNVPLGVFLVCAVAGRLLPSSTLSDVVSGVGTAALVVWAGDEVLRGVNPWRRLLGIVVLAAQAVMVLRRL